MEILKQKRAGVLISLCITFFFFIFDLGNLDGLRQGTEGFYLKITNEMFSANSFLEPLYNGQRHWSKPPFQFWMPQPLFYLFGESNIFLSRLSMVIFTLLGTYYISHWIKKSFGIEQLVSFVFFASSLAFFKYGRIFMMEMPLAVLSSCSFITFYQYFTSDNKKSFWLGSLFLGFSALVKGPVSFVMVLGALFLYCLYAFKTRKEIYIKKLILITLTSIIIASPWFIISYINHGQEFFNYFFLRENMGKFASKPYPKIHVLQGLFLYSLPWSLYIFQSFKQIINNKLKSDKLTYLIIGMVFFFVLWLIPNQRSHHYAVPAIPLLLTILLTQQYGKKLSKVSKAFHLIYITIILIFICAFVFLTQRLSLVHIGLLPTLLTAASAVMYLLVVWKNKSLIYIAQSNLICIGLIWIVLIPSAALPKMPQRIIDTIGEKEVATVVRKPYFISQAIGRPVLPKGRHEIKAYIQQSDNFYLMPKELYLKQHLEQETKIVQEWTVWRSGLKTRQIFKAIQSRNVQPLQTVLVLLQKK